jgi:hypothetical protein
VQDISLKQIHPSSLKIGYWILSGIINVFLIIVLLFCTINTLTSVPIDKFLMCLCSFIIALINPDKILFSSRELLVVMLFTGTAVLSSVMNLIIFPMIFFPITGLCFAIILSRYKTTVLVSLYYALFIHIIIGIILLILAILGFTNFDVSTGAKGFASLYATHGFTSTVQTYGTLCISWLMLYILRKKMGLNTGIDKFFFLIANLAILLTFNRSTYLFWLIVLFFEFHFLFWSIAVLVGAILIRFWNIITSFILSTSSIVSRFQLLEGFKISYLQSHSIKVYLFGRGTNQISEDIAKRVKWTTRTDLENGYTMLLHSYGIIGLSIYIAVCFYFIFMFLKIKRFKEAFFLFFYFFITQYITQEFVATTFYMFLAIMLFIYNTYSEQINLSRQQTELQTVKARNIK